MPSRRRGTGRRKDQRIKSADPKGQAPERTLSGLPLPLVADPSGQTDSDYLERLGFPGEPPYTRGIRGTMYRGRLWTMRQYAGFGTAKETNRRFKYLIKQGNEGLSVAFDLPTQMGYDSDAPLARGEVGRVGVAISTGDEMRLLGVYTAAAGSLALDRKAPPGTAQHALLKEYIARSPYIYPPPPSIRRGA